MKGLQNLYGSEGEVKGKEAVIAAAAAGVPHHDDTQELLAGAGVTTRHRWFGTRA